MRKGPRGALCPTCRAPMRGKGMRRDCATPACRGQAKRDYGRQRRESKAPPSARFFPAGPDVPGPPLLSELEDAGTCPRCRAREAIDGNALSDMRGSRARLYCPNGHSRWATLTTQPEGDLTVLFRRWSVR